MANPRQRSRPDQDASQTSEAPATQPEPEVTEEARPQRKRIPASSVAPTFLEIVEAAGENGISLKEIEEQYKARNGGVLPEGVDYRVFHNVGWTLEGKPDPRRGDGNSNEDFGKLTDPEGRKIHRLPGSAVRYAFGVGDEVPETSSKVTQRQPAAAAAS